MDRNLILAIALSMGVLLAWDIFISGPQREAYQEAQKAAQEAEAAAAADAETGEADIAGLTPGADRRRVR